MGKDYTKIRSEFLGMNCGNAQTKLLKQLLLKYVTLANEHYCYRCGLVINNVDDFSVDHKVNWLYNSIESFWDLDNIAFSHLKCNNMYKRYTPKRKVAPDGMSRCSKCSKFLSVDNFGKYAPRWNGLTYWCKSCRGSKGG